GLGDLLRIERVRDHRLGAHLGDQVPIGLLVRHPDDLVPDGDQPWQELLAHHTRSASTEPLHLPLLLSRGDSGQPTDVVAAPCPDAFGATITERSVSPLTNR